MTYAIDKTIKLWKVFEKSLRVVTESNHFDGTRPVAPPGAKQQLRLPRMQAQESIVAAVPRKVYANAHAYHIHSISVNSDQETYISADDLRINLWNLNISDQSFSMCPSSPLRRLYSCAYPDRHQISSISSQSTWKS
jgi:serine/threonine-protein phosphatase 2A regulatory subunit B